MLAPLRDRSRLLLLLLLLELVLFSLAPLSFIYLFALWLRGATG